MSRVTARLVRATTSFTCDVEGVEHFVRAGEVLPATDPVVKGREELFEPAEPVEADGRA